MSGANARRVRVELRDERGGSPSTLTGASPTLSQWERDYWLDGSAFNGYLRDRLNGCPPCEKSRSVPVEA